MPKIDTAYLKQHVACGECGSKNIKRRHKQSFKSKVDAEGNIVPEFKVNWRVFECADCGENTNVLDDGNEILAQRAWYALHPFSCFEFVVYMYHEGDGEYQLTLDMYYKENVNEEFVCVDDLRDDHILGFAGFFKNLGFNVDNLMENQWEVWQGNGMPDWETFQPTEEHIATLKKALEDVGAVYNKELCYFDGIEEVTY